MMAFILKNKTTTLLGILFSITSMIGWVYCSYPENDFVFYSPYKFLFLASGLLCFFCGYKVILSFGFYALKIAGKRCCGTDSRKTVSYMLFDKAPFRVFLIVSCIIYGFWWVAFFPGTLHPDMTHHLYQGLGIMPLNENVPIFLTKFVGFIMTLAKVYFLDDNVGVMIYVSGSLLLQCFTVGYLFFIFRKAKTPYFIRWFACIYVYVLPVMAVWGVNFGKDAPYYIFLLLFVCALADILVTYDMHTTVNWFGALIMTLAGVGASWCRNNGSAIIIISLVVAAVCCTKRLRVIMIGCCMTCIVILYGFDLFVSSHYDVAPSPIRESYSIPLQTYVSYLREYINEIDENEAEMIRDMFSVDPVELIAVYNPKISDPVKNQFCSYPSDDQLKRFWSCYIKAFANHPKVFIRGLFRHIYGYFYPGQGCYADRIAIYTLNYLDDYYSFRYVWDGSSLREKMIGYSEGVYHLPIVGYLYRPGTQMLLLISLFAYAVSGKNKRKACLFVPSLLMVFVIFSPVCAYFRYMLPVFVALPINMAWAVYTADTASNIL